MRQNGKHREEKKPGRTPMDTALSYLGYRARTVREVERHLDEKQYGEYEIMQVIDRLTELNLLNDAQFAHDFVESRLRTKPVSKRSLREQLLAHELPREIIEDALSDIPEETEQQNAVQAAKKYLAQYEDAEKEERERRVTRRLLSRGFSYETVKRAMQSFELDAPEDMEI